MIFVRGILPQRVDKLIEKPVVVSLWILDARLPIIAPDT